MSIDDIFALTCGPNFPALLFFPLEKVHYKNQVGIAVLSQQLGSNYDLTQCGRVDRIEILSNLSKNKTMNNSIICVVFDYQEKHLIE